LWWSRVDQKTRDPYCTYLRQMQQLQQRVSHAIM
jgi:hypothetical protein